MRHTSLLASLLLVACDQPIFARVPSDASTPADGSSSANDASSRDASSMEDRDASSGAQEDAGLDATVPAAADGGDVDASVVDAGGLPVEIPDLSGHACDALRQTVLGSGRAIAVGDFDGNGVSDFALGNPGDDQSSGAVCVYLGSEAAGSRALGPCVRWTQASDGVSGVAEPGDRCGASLAAGDFDGDGVDDLAIGCPGEALSMKSPEAGQITVLFGKAQSGLDLTRGQRLVQSLLDRTAEAYDHFGATLAATDFNMDGIADLAMGSPNESAVSFSGVNVADTGVVMVLSGKAGVGLDFPDSYVGIGQEPSFRNLSVPGMVVGRDDVYEVGDRFGSALAVAQLRFDGILRPTLIIGAPGEDGGKGVVQLLAGGTSAGLGAPTARAVLSLPESTRHEFGSVVAAMSDDRVFVGSPYAYNTEGAVWSFRLTNTWYASTPVEIRKPEAAGSKAKADDLFARARASTSEW